MQHNLKLMVRPVLAALLAALASAACVAGQPAAIPPGQEAAAQAATPVRVGVGYIPSVQFAPWYVGIERGFFAEEGLDVSLEYGFENDYLKLVGTDELQFMVGSGDQVVLGRAQGLPVRYVMNWYSHYPVVIFAKAEAGIGAPEELRGKRIGLPGLFGANYVALRGILEGAGLTEADVQLESVGFAQVAALSEDKVDAAVDYAVNGPIVMELEGIAVTQIGLDPYLAIPANGIVTNERTIAGQPDLVRRVVRAFARSVQYAIDHPDEAFAIALRAVPEAGGENETANRAIFDASLDYWTPRAGRTPWATTAQDWQTAAEFMQRVGLVDTLVPAEELFTNEFVE
jgi:NitT/TauT family transport system substrate-binding protein